MKKVTRISLAAGIVSFLLLICTKMPNDMDKLENNADRPVAIPDLVLPPDNATNQVSTQAVVWQTIKGAVSYHLQIAKDSLFSLIVVDDSTLDSMTLSHGLNLPADKITYYWRVRAKNSYNKVSEWSVVRSFTIRQQKPQSLTYDRINDTCVLRAPILINQAHFAGGTPDSFTISPPLPTGLIFSKNSGSISGKPTGTASSSSYTVTAANDSGITQTTIRITTKAVVHPPFFVSGMTNRSTAANTKDSMIVVAKDSSRFDTTRILFVNSDSLKTIFGADSLTFSTINDTIMKIFLLPGTHSGTYPITIRLSDGTDSTTQTVMWTVGKVNHPPVWTNKTITDTVSEGRIYSLSLPEAVSDADGDILTYKLLNGAPPTDQITGTLYRFAPTYADSGSYVIHITANDMQDTDTLSIKLKVKNANRKPQFATDSPLTSYLITAGDSLIIPCKATDADNDPITYFIQNQTLPRKNAVFSDSAIRYKSQTGDLGSYIIDIAAFDGKDTTTIRISAGIGNINVKPRVTISGVVSGGTITTTEGRLLTLAVKKSDPNTGDGTRFVPIEKAPWLDASGSSGSFDTSTGAFSYTPSFSVSSATENKTYTGIRFIAYDNGTPVLSDTFVLNIMVEDSISNLSQPQLSIPADMATNQPISQSFSWAALGGALTYHIQVATSNTFTPATIVVEDSAVTTNSRAVLNLTTGIIYYWRVQAKDATGPGPWSLVSSFTTTIAAPGTPSLSTPVNGETAQPITTNIIWSTVNGATKYRVQVSKSATFDTVFTDTTTAAASKMLSNLEYLTSYYWRVQAINTGGSSSWTSAWKFTTNIAPPSAPALIAPEEKAAGVSVNTEFLWSTTATTTSYYIVVATDSLFTAPVFFADSLVTDAKKDVTGMNNSQVYYWKVRAKNGGGISAWSSYRSFTTLTASLATPVLSAPNNGDAAQSVAPVISWSASVGATRYRYHVSTSNTFTTNVIEDTVSGSTSKQLSKLSNNTTYYWQVRAENSTTGATSPWSTLWSFTTLVAKLTTPSLSSPSDGAAAQPLTPTLTWTAVNNAKYNVQISTNSSFSTLVSDDPDLTTTSKNLSGLSNNTQYYWRVRATNESGESDWSTAWSFTTIPAAPAAPLLSSPAKDAAGVPLMPTLQWQSVPLATSYVLQVATTDAFTSSVMVSQDTVTGVSRIFTTPLEFGRNYYWRVAARNTGGQSNWSSIWSFTTVVDTPDIISPKNGETNLPKTVKLLWKKINGATMYYYQIGTTPDFVNGLISSDSTSDTSKTASIPYYNSLFYWHVKAANAGTSGAWSNISTFSTMQTVPEAPVLSSPGANATHQLSPVFLQWLFNGDAYRYNVLVSRSVNFHDTLVFKQAIVDTFVKIDSLTAGSYYWKVQAVNNLDVGTWSDSRSFSVVELNWSETFSGTDKNIITSVAATSKVAVAGLNTGSVMYSLTDGTWNSSALCNKPIDALFIADSIIFAGSRGAGIFKSPDLKGTFAPSNSGLPNEGNVTVSGFAKYQNVIYVALNQYGIYSSSDLGASWAPLKTQPVVTSDISGITVSKSGKIYVAALNEGVYSSIDNGDSWVKITLYGTNYRCITASDSVSGCVYMSSATAVYKSIDEGLSWTTLLYSSTDIYSLTEHANTVFAGDYSGNVLFYSPISKKWSMQTKNLPHNTTAPVFVAIYPKYGPTVLAGTSGYGLYQSAIP